MSKFTTPLVLMPWEGGRYLTERPLSFDIGFKGSGLTVTVPRLFVTDLASVPRFFWWFLPPYDPQYAAAAVLHDYLLSLPDFDRMTAHSVFLEALTSLGVPNWKAWVMFLAVVFYGRLTSR